MNVKKERIFYYDLLRAIAIIAVIICHMDLFFGSLNSPIEIVSHSLFRNLGGVGVPIFLMISGALLLNKDYDLKTFMRKRFSRIIGPFILWFIIISFGLYYFNQADLIWKFFNGTYSVTWYFWALIGIYLFLPIINSFIKEYGEKGLEYFLIIWFITIILKTIYKYPLFPNFDLINFTGLIGYPVLGYYLDNKKFKFSNLNMIIISLVIFLVSWIFFVYMQYYNLNFIDLSYLTVPMVFLSGSVFLLVKYMSDGGLFNSLKNNILGKAITSISLCSYGMYYSHVIVLKGLLMFNPKSNLLFPVMFALMIFFSWLLPMIISKIPFIGDFSGVG